MNGSITKKSRFAVSHNTIANFAFIAYFSMPFIRMAIGFLRLSSIAYPIAFFITYVPVLLLVPVNREKANRLMEFGVLFILLALILGVSLMIHPDYEYWFTRETYGVLPYIFRPDNGIYAFLFIRLVKNPNVILKNLRISGCLMYVYFLRQLLNALSTGYWLNENAAGEMVQFSYSLDFGYSVLFFALVFLYLALRDKDIFDIGAAALGVAMILVGGSRGAVLCLGIFVVIYMLIAFQKSRRKFLYISIVAIVSVVIDMFYQPILYAVAAIMDRFNLPSRFIYKILEGSITDGQGRDAIWNAAINMIKEKPLLGYGAMGARPVISQYHNVGYPHNLFIEWFIEYGVIIGGISAVLLVGVSIIIFVRKDLGEWRFVYVIAFANACELMLSYTYWHKQALWICIALFISIRGYCKRKKYDRLEATERFIS